MTQERVEADSLEACLMLVGERLQRPFSRGSLRDAQSGSAAELSLRDAIAAAEANGLICGLAWLPLHRLDASILPAIAFLHDGHAVLIEGRDPDGTLIITDVRFGRDSGEIAEARIAQAYSGRVLVVRPRSRQRPERGEGNGHWFWGTIARGRWLYAQVILAAIVANLLGLTTSIFTMTVYDRVLPNEAVASLIALTAGVGIALVFDFLIKSLRAAFIDRAGRQADSAMGRLIFDQLLNMRMATRADSIGGLANTLREFETLRDFFASATLVSLVDLPFILLFLLVVYLIGGPIVLVPAVAVPLVLVVGLAIQPFLARGADRLLREGQSKQGVLVETIAGLETIKAVGAGGMMRERWQGAMDRQADLTLSARALSQFALNATGFVQQAAQVLLVFHGVFLIQDGRLSVGALIACVILTGRALTPLAQVAQALTRLHHARSSYRALDALMRQPADRPEGRHWLSRPRLAGAVSFSDVSFAYPGQSRDALRGLSLTIGPGEKVAILGRIGSGKSTIARLLLGLYTPRDGTVALDGTDIRQIDPADLRRNIGAVLQDVWLFSGTLRDNIAVGMQRPADEDILRAARISGADEVAKMDPHGYDMRLGERGECLSGGQRQVVALARALVGAPPLLVLDEPTSAMDVQGEREMIRRLKETLGPETLIVITHRTSLLELVDRVIVLDAGRVVADGPKSILARGAVTPIRTRGAEGRADGTDG